MKIKASLNKCSIEVSDSKTLEPRAMRWEVRMRFSSQIKMRLQTN